MLDVNNNAVHVLDRAADEALKIYAEQREMGRKNNRLQVIDP